MIRSDAVARAEVVMRRRGLEAAERESYESARICTLGVESLVTWDVLAHAEREQARLTVVAGAEQPPRTF